LKEHRKRALFQTVASAS